MKRALLHLVSPPWRVRQTFPKRSMLAIAAAIRESEKYHSGQIRFAVEASLDSYAISRGITARERAIEVFSRLRVWDTERNNGVLIYLLLADRDVEIVADRGIDSKVGAAEWERICHTMEEHFRAHRFEQGVIEGTHAVSAHLVRHFPGGSGDTNELPDQPVVI